MVLRVTVMSGFSFNRHKGKLDVSPIETSKDKIEQPDLAKDENMYIPPIGSSVVISGKSGSGKSTLLANLMKDPRFYGPSPSKPKGWFDKVFIFSPTANGDDVQRSLNIPANHVFTDLDEVPELLDMILDTQQSKLDGGGSAHEVPQFALIFDDVIGDTKFMNMKAFTRCFYQVRHVNCTTFICTQHFKRVPKVCRMQANFLYFFQGAAAEVEMVAEEFAPPMYTKKEFIQLVVDATRKPFDFLTINMKVPWDKRFRRNLNDFVVLDRLASSEKDVDSKAEDPVDSGSDTSDDGGSQSSVREGVDGGGDRQSAKDNDWQNSWRRNTGRGAQQGSRASLRDSTRFPSSRSS